MHLKKSEFDVLAAAHRGEAQSQRRLARACGFSLGLTNRCCQTLEEAELMRAYQVTPEGADVLEQFRVQRAVVLADRFDARLVPYTHERPKAALQVGGAPLVERIIAQLRGAGIDDITVVVGSHMEHLFYLEDQPGVSLCVNESFDAACGLTSLFALGDLPACAYVVDGGQYFEKNPFRPFEYSSYVLVDDDVRRAGRQEVVCVSRSGLLAAEGARRSERKRLLPFAYIDDHAAYELRAVVPDLAHDIPLAPTSWEALATTGAPDAFVRARDAKSCGLREITSVEDLNELRDAHQAAPRTADGSRAVDARLASSGSVAIDRICRVLGCAPHNVRDIARFGAEGGGYLFTFTVNGKPYLYQQDRLSCTVLRACGSFARPGKAPGQSEADVKTNARMNDLLKRVRAAGVSVATVYRDEVAGWEVSGGVPFDGSRLGADRAATEAALAQLRKLQESGIDFDTASVWDEAQAAARALEDASDGGFPQLADTRRLVERLHARIVADGEIRPCHGNVRAQSFVKDADAPQGGIALRGWGAAHLDDYAVDPGSLFASGRWTPEAAVTLLQSYFGLTPTDGEVAHCLAAVSVVSFCRFTVLAVAGTVAREQLHRLCRNARLFGRAAQERYARLSHAAMIGA